MLQCHSKYKRIIMNGIGLFHECALERGMTPSGEVIKREHERGGKKGEPRADDLSRRRMRKC